MNAGVLLQCALLGLAGLYAAWFVRADDWIAFAVFAGPALLLVVLGAVRPRAAAFWAGVLALAWFSHGVMVAWSRPDERGFAWAEIALSLLAIGAANFAALRARFGQRAGR
jgi:uncharacterized membrane protein